MRYRFLFRSLVFLTLILGYPFMGCAATVQGAVGWLGAEDKSGVIVYLEGVKGDFPPSEIPHEMDQREKLFIPHVLPILQGEKVAFLNSDPFLHNVHVFLGRESLFNLAMIKSSSPRVKTFDRPGAHVVLCDVHPEMEGWIVVLENPYFATTDENGYYRIEDVPEGTYTLKTWHQKLKSRSEEVTLEEGKASEVNLTLPWE